MAFFFCKNCKFSWPYPIEKCPECFSNLERVEGEEAKVIGIGKNSIPSVFHLRVPYFVLVLEDEKGNRWLQKSKKEYKIGDEFKSEISLEKEGIAIWKVKYDFLEAIKKITKIFEGLKISPDSKILILPTLEKVSHPHLRDNTSPEFLEATLNFLFEKGMRKENIKVASQSFDEIDIEEKFSKSGLSKVCQKYQISFIDLAKGNFLKKEDLEISKEVFETDVIFNLPILKMKRAQATENLFFILKKENFLAQKYLYSEKEIYEKIEKTLFSKEKPEIFTIAEASHIQDEKGVNYYLNLIFASFSPKNLERVFFEIAKKPLPEILKDVKIENIKILGREIEEI